MSPAQERSPHTPQDEGQGLLWLFGYGSLIYKVDFPYLKRSPAHVNGWLRRFWQGSHDHRGSPQAPGRVTTLVPTDNGRCGGMAYLIESKVLRALDEREKNGYQRTTVDLHFPAPDDAVPLRGLTYVAPPDNSAWLGPASERQIAEQIASAQGPSGRNRDYLLRLAESLRELDEHDEHVFTIERHLLATPATPALARIG